MILDRGFTTPQLADVFSAENRVGLFCRFEAALAQAQGERGDIPKEAAAAIVEVCGAPPADADGILARGWEEGTPVLVLLERLQSQIPERHREYLHRGATTQDVVDSALMLQCQAGLSLLDRSLSSAGQSLAERADRHRHTVTVGRTFLQEAVPMSLGSRFALWLQAVVNTRRELGRVRDRLPLQLGGPVGDGAPFGKSAPALADAMAQILGLAAPATSWHTDRWPVQEVAAAASRVAAVTSKIATDVATLSASGEIRVRAGRSSSMAHKRNPVDAIRAEAAAEVCRAAAAGLLSSPAHVLERGMGPWHAEWALVPVALQAGGAACQAIERCLASLEVQAAERDAATDGGVVDQALGDHRALEGG